MAAWPPPQREDLFQVGDVVWYNIPVVMDCCRSWAPDITKPVTVIAVKDAGHNTSHKQLIRVTPNYNPYGDEFGGIWFLPVGIESHNDKAYSMRPDVVALREWQIEREKTR